MWSHGKLEDAPTMTLQHSVMVGFHVVSDVTLQLCPTLWRDTEM